MGSSPAIPTMTENRKIRGYLTVIQRTQDKMLLERPDGSRMWVSHTNGLIQPLSQKERKVCKSWFLSSNLIDRITIWLVREDNSEHWSEEAALSHYNWLQAKRKKLPS